MDNNISKVYEVAKKHNIILYKEYINDDEEYTEVYLPLNKLRSVCDDDYIENTLNIDLNQNKVLAAKLYKNKYNVLDARPFNLKVPKRYKNKDMIQKVLSNNIKAVSKSTILVSFLNKDKSDEVFDEYISCMCENMYDFKNYQIDRDMLANLTVKGQKMTEEDIVFQQKRFKFVNGFEKANKDIKMKVVNQGLYWDESDEIHSKIRKAIHCLLETDSFIHSGIIAKKANVSPKDAKKYRPVFKDLIDSHNKSIYDTKSYVEYINDINRKAIDLAISELESQGRKVTNVNIAKETGLHVNTVSNNRK